jgi:hypothetical protein
MSNPTDRLIDSFVSKLKAAGMLIQPMNNTEGFDELEAKLPKRLPQSFASLLSRYSFPSFNVGGISLFAWDSVSNEYSAEAAATKGSLSELLLPAGYVQIGRPDTGVFDAICFDLNTRKQNREYQIVEVDHEDILIKWRVTVRRKLWSSFHEVVARVVSTTEYRVY